MEIKAQIVNIQCNIQCEISALLSGVALIEVSVKRVIERREVRVTVAVVARIFDEVLAGIILVVVGSDFTVLTQHLLAGWRHCRGGRNGRG